MKIEHFEIKDAKIEYATELTDILNEALSETNHYLFTFHNKITLNEQVDYLRYVQSKKGSLFLVAFIKNEIIGFLDFVCHRGLEKYDFGVLGIVVKKNYRQKRIASRLFNELIKRKDVNIIKAEVLITNKPVINFLHQNNFVIDNDSKKAIEFKNEKTEVLLMLRNDARSNEN